MKWGRELLDPHEQVLSRLKIDRGCKRVLPDRREEAGRNWHLNANKVDPGELKGIQVSVWIDRVCDGDLLGGCGGSFCSLANDIKY